MELSCSMFSNGLLNDKRWPHLKEVTDNPQKGLFQCARRAGESEPVNLLNKALSVHIPRCKIGLGSFFILFSYERGIPPLKAPARLALPIHIAVRQPA